MRVTIWVCLISVVVSLTLDQLNILVNMAKVSSDTETISTMRYSVPSSVVPVTAVTPGLKDITYKKPNISTDLSPDVKREVTGKITNISTSISLYVFDFHIVIKINIIIESIYFFFFFFS